MAESATNIVVVFFYGHNKIYEKFRLDIILKYFIKIILWTCVRRVRKLRYINEFDGNNCDQSEFKEK